LAHDLIFTVVTYQVYDMNGYTFYTEQQDKKSTYQNSGVHVDAYDVTGEDKSMYYGQIQEIWELDFHNFIIQLFQCNWVDVIKGDVKNKYVFLEGGFFETQIYLSKVENDLDTKEELKRLLRRELLGDQEPILEY
jgi:hypothetical protein